MKKVLRLVIFMFVFFAGMNMVMAQGPKSDGYIKVVTYTRDNETATYLYSKTETIQTLNGISYDEEKNTLTLNNYSAERVSIQIHNMGDFKINVIGSNVINSGYKTAIDVTGNNSTTVYGDGSISFSGDVGIKSDTGILNIENVNLSNIVDFPGSLIVSEGTVNIEDSTLNFDFFGYSYSEGIISNDDIIIKNSNISGNVGTGIKIWSGEKGNISIINSTIDLLIVYHDAICTENDLNIENSTIKVKNGNISGMGTTNISNSNIDMKKEIKDVSWISMSTTNLNINDSDINIYNAKIVNNNNAQPYSIAGKDIIINGGTVTLNTPGVGIGLYDNDEASLTIKKGNFDITADVGISVYRSDPTANFTMENGKLVIKSLLGMSVTNAYFNGGYVEIDASNKDGIFGEEPGIGTVFAMESINIASNVEISDNLKVYKLDTGEGFCIYYLNDEEIVLNEQNPEPKPLLKNVIIKDKNYKEEEITPPNEEENHKKEEMATTKEVEKNDAIENPKTADITINIVIPLLLGAMFFVLIGIQKLKKINHK